MLTRQALHFKTQRTAHRRWWIDQAAWNQQEVKYTYSIFNLCGADACESECESTCQEYIYICTKRRGQGVQQEAGEGYKCFL